MKITKYQNSGKVGSFTKSINPEIQEWLDNGGDTEEMPEPHVHLVQNGPYAYYADDSGRPVNDTRILTDKPIEPVFILGDLSPAGDLKDIGEAVKDVVDGNYLAAAAGIGGLLLPEFISKPIKNALRSRRIARELNRAADAASLPTTVAQEPRRLVVKSVGNTSKDGNTISLQAAKHIKENSDKLKEFDITYDPTNPILYRKISEIPEIQGNTIILRPGNEASTYRDLYNETIRSYIENPHNPLFDNIKSLEELKEVIRKRGIEPGTRQASARGGRYTYHFTLDQPVTSHGGGNWDGNDVIAIPFNDVFSAFGKEGTLNMDIMDTFFGSPGSVKIPLDNIRVITESPSRARAYKKRGFSNVLHSSTDNNSVISHFSGLTKEQADYLEKLTGLPTGAREVNGALEYYSTPHTHSRSPMAYYEFTGDIDTSIKNALNASSNSELNKRWTSFMEELRKNGVGKGKYKLGGIIKAQDGTNVPEVLYTSKHPGAYYTYRHPTGVAFADGSPGELSTNLYYSDEDLRKRQLYMESAGNPKAQSSAGAKGAYQIKSDALTDYTNNTGKTGDLLDAGFNREVRDFYMNLIKKSRLYKNTTNPVVATAKQYAAYNWGMGNLGKYLESLKKENKDIYNSLDWVEGLPKETRDYVNFIVLGHDTEKKTESDYQKLIKKGILK